jgi:glycosyltransferase involved in cell wall biosynthesis
VLTICHILDKTTGWEQRLAINQLLGRLPSDRFRQIVATFSGHLLRDYGHAAKRARPIAPAGLSFLRAGLFNRLLSRESVDLVHAWGAGAATAAASSGLPLVIELFDPQLAQESTRRLRTIVNNHAGYASRPPHRGDQSNTVGIVCAAELVRRRLIEGGVQPDHCPVIRPGVDFHRINKLRRQPLRETLGISREHRVIIVPPSSRDGGQFEAVWAASLLNHLDHNVWVITPGDTRESRRVARFAAALPTENALIRSDLSFEELLVHADVLVAPGHQDTSTTAIAWAMAAGVPVIAAATRANAELIAHKVGGLLYKPSREGSDAPAIVRLLKDEAAQAKAKEIASGQAYEVFGLRRYVEQHAKLYDNLLHGKPAATGVEDSARAGGPSPTQAGVGSR